MKVEFDWDEGNLQHIIYDHPERDNRKEEVESIFYDPYFSAVFDRLDPNTEEPRYCGLGVGTEGIEKYVVFVVRNGKIRPVTCHRAKRKQRREYHEIIRQAKEQESENRNP